MTYLRLGGKENFTNDESVVNRCFENSEALTSHFGNNRDAVIAYYLTEVWAKFQSFSPELINRTYKLTNEFDAKKAGELYA